MLEDARYCQFETSLGVAGIAWAGGKLLAVELPEPPTDRTGAHLRRVTRTDTPAPPDEFAAGIVERLKRYFAGEPVDFTDIPLALAKMPAASRRVYDHVRMIPWGSLQTYGQVAEAIGQPGGAQSVGQAMGANPVPVVIPCHRVVAANGKLGGFSAPGGNRLKARLLQMEQASLRTPDDPQMQLL